MRIPTFATFCLSICAAAPQSWSLQQAALPDGAQIRTHFPGTLSLAPGFGEMTCGYYNGDLRKDGMTAIGGVVYFIGGLDVMQVTIEAEPGSDDVVNDLVTLEGDAPFGLDLVVTAGSSGLRALEVDPSSGLFNSRSLAGSAWGGVVELHRADLDGDGHLDVMGLSADRHEILGLRGIGDGTFGTWFAFSYLEEIRQIGSADWPGGAGARDLVVLLDDRLQVVDTTGAVVEQFPSDDPYDLFEVYTNREEPHDSIATVTRTNGGTEQWISFKKPNGASTGGFDMTILDVVRIKAADMNDDGAEDLTLQVGFQPNILVLFNFENDPNPPGGLGLNAFNFGLPPLTIPIDLDAPGALMINTRGDYIVSDLDQDGDIDVYCPNAWEEDIVTQRNNRYSESARKGYFRYFQFRLLPQGVEATTSINWPIPATEITHVQIEVFQDDDPVPIDTLFIPIEVATNGEYTVFMLPEQSLIFTSQYYFVSNFCVLENGVLTFVDTTSSFGPVREDGGVGTGGYNALPVLPPLSCPPPVPPQSPINI